MNREPIFDKNYKEKQIVVTTSFNAPLETIWNAFTNSGVLEKWFAPKPYSIVTKDFIFNEGGHWLYYMLSPEGEKYWSLSEFVKIVAHDSFRSTDAFTDENGVVNTEFPRAVWDNSFVETNGVTTVKNIITFPHEEDINQILKMGFEEGYTISLKQLQSIL